MAKKRSGIRKKGTAPWYAAVAVGLALTITPEPITTAAGASILLYTLTGKK